MPVKKITTELKKLREKLKEKEYSLKKQKKLSKKTIQVARQAVKNLKNETKKHIVTAIVAGFGFIIALVWRDTIKEYVSVLITKFSVSGPSTLITLYTAIITTIIAVVGIVIITKWGSES